MTKDEVLDFLLEHGWERKGKRILIKNTEAMRSHRYVMMDKILRHEVCSDSIMNHWTMITHGYYGQLSINEKGKLAGMKPWNL